MGRHYLTCPYGSLFEKYHNIEALTSGFLPFNNAHYDALYFASNAQAIAHFIGVQSLAPIIPRKLKPPVCELYVIAIMKHNAFVLTSNYT